MSVEFLLQKNISIGQKSKDQSGPYGQGFNYIVEATFLWSEDNRPAEKHLATVLKAIDHRLLGIDNKDIADPTTANICAWIFERLKECGSAVIQVRLLRGDGLEARIP